MTTRSVLFATLQTPSTASSNLAEEMDFEGFRQDLKTIATVERKLLVISEAAIRLKEDAARLCPGLPWPEIRGIDSWLRHQYDRVDLKTPWNTLLDDLPPRSTSVRRALSNLPTKDSTPEP